VDRVVERARLLADDSRVRYLMAGGLVAGLYLAVFTGLSLAWRSLHYLLVLAVAQVIIISIAFPLYRSVVFRSDGGVRGDLARFLGVWGGNLVLGTAGLALLVQVVHVPQIPAQFVVVVAVSVVSFLGHRLFSFRHAPSAPGAVEDRIGTDSSLPGDVDAERVAGDGAPVD
jgi:putative flippase GtrA